MPYDLSLCLAGIRPHFWKGVYNSAIASCKRHSFELVIISPYDLPDELKEFSNVKHVKEWGPPVRASQIGTIHCEGKWLTFPCDDGLLLEDACDLTLDFANAIAAPKDGIIIRYREGFDMQGRSWDDNFWYARSHVSSPYIGHDWKIAPIPMMTLEYYRHLGGVDCTAFECMAFATHDLCYRLQRDGGVFHLSPVEVINADNYGDVGKDHAPIHYGQTTHDQPEFNRMYASPAVQGRICIDFNTWKAAPEVWSRRWANGKPA